MNKSIVRYLSLLLAVVLCLGLFPARVFAEDVVKAKVPVQMNVEGPTVEADKEDSFTVEIVSNTEGAPMPASSKLQLKAGESGTYEMEYPHVGVYSYTISQTKGDKDYITYDDTQYTLTVYVTNENGKVQVQYMVADGDGEKYDPVPFTNVYDDGLDPARLDPPIKKVIEGPAPEGSVFTFEMKPEPADAPMPDCDEGERTGDDSGALYYDMQGEGEHEFGWMEYGEEDVGKTYKYTLKELPGNDPNWTYDTNEYTITVTVKMAEERNEDGNRQIILDVDGKEITEQKLDPYVFTNKYQEPADKSGHLTVKKTVTNTPKNGKTYTVGETISFQVTVVNDGDLTITDIKVSDALTGDEWGIDSLDPGMEKSFTTTYKVTEADSKAGSVTNVATATGVSPDPDHPDVPTEDGKVTVPVEKPDVETPKTGDDTNIALWIGLMVAAAIGMCAVAILARKRRKA